MTSAVTSFLKCSLRASLSSRSLSQSREHSANIKCSSAIRVRPFILVLYKRISGVLVYCTLFVGVSERQEVAGRAGDHELQNRGPVGANAREQPPRLLDVQLERREKHVLHSHFEVARCVTLETCDQVLFTLNTVNIE